MERVREKDILNYLENNKSLSKSSKKVLEYVLKRHIHGIKTDIETLNRIPYNSIINAKISVENLVKTGRLLDRDGYIVPSNKVLQELYEFISVSLCEKEGNGFSKETNTENTRTITYGDQYSLTTFDLPSANVSELGFSSRLSYRLFRIGCRSVSRLLSLDDNELVKYQIIDHKDIEELHVFFDSLCEHKESYKEERCDEPVDDKKNLVTCSSAELITVENKEKTEQSKYSDFNAPCYNNNLSATDIVYCRTNSGLDEGNQFCFDNLCEHKESYKEERYDEPVDDKKNFVACSSAELKTVENKEKTEQSKYSDFKAPCCNNNLSITDIVYCRTNSGLDKGNQFGSVMKDANSDCLRYEDLTSFDEDKSSRELGYFTNKISNNVIEKDLEGSRDHEGKSKANNNTQIEPGKENTSHFGLMDENLGNRELLYLKKRDIDAFGYRLENGAFIIKKGSKVSKIKKKTCVQIVEKSRQTYNDLIDCEGYLKSDIKFNSLYSAKRFCLYGEGSITDFWKTRDGLPLKDYRNKKTECVAPKSEQVQEKRMKSEDTKKETLKISTNNEKAENITTTFMLTQNRRITTEGTRSGIKATSRIEKKSNVDKVEYYIRYGMDPSDYAGVYIEGQDFTIRLSNRLLRKKIFTVERLLKESDYSLKKTGGLGIKCLNELHYFFSALSNNSERVVLSEYGNYISKGDFSFLESATLSKEQLSYVMRFKEAYSVIDHSLIEECFNGTQAIYQLREALEKFALEKQSKKECERLYATIPSSILNMEVLWLIEMLVSNQDSINYLKELITIENETLEEYINGNIDKYIVKDANIVAFLGSCKFSLKDELSKLFQKIIKNEREFRIIQARASETTLDIIGRQCGVTRERVRQIEGKLYNRFAYRQRVDCILQKIFIELGEKHIVSSSEISQLIGEYGDITVYLLKKCKIPGYKYDKSKDSFVNALLEHSFDEFVSELPTMFMESDLEKYTNIFQQKYSLPGRMLTKSIEATYNKTGRVFHMSKLDLKDIYGFILKKYYPNGMHVYDRKEMSKFKEIVKVEFEIDISDKSDHSIESVLTRIGILSDRGTYRLRTDEALISEDLKEKIYDYIQGNDGDVFLYNTIFVKFKEELIEEGVDNKYYLQGILKHLFEDKLYFTKDYVSKNKDYINLSTRIYEWVEESEYPVFKDAIVERYPGLTDIIVLSAISKKGIINLYGKYIHCNKLKITDGDRKYLDEVLDSFLEKKSFHCHDIYEFVKKDYPSLLSNNYIDSAFGFFSLMEHLFNDKCYFKRPFIALSEDELERMDSLIETMLRNNSIVKTTELLALAKTYRKNKGRILDYLNSFNDTHLLISRNEMASITYIGITNEIANEVERIIKENIVGTVEISQMEVLNKLPRINISWSPWLVYSVLNKWSNKVEVGLSNSQFKIGEPLVAQPGEFNPNLKTVGCSEKTVLIIDDMYDFDDIYEELTMEDLEEFDEL